MSLLAALVCAAVAAGAGLAVPALLPWLPEPAPAGQEGAAGAREVSYAEVAAAPHLGAWCAGASAVAAGLLGWRLGWSWPLVWLVPLCPVAVTLAVIDARTWRLPTRIVWPAYAGVLVAMVLVTGVTERYEDLGRAVVGQVAAVALFGALWWLPGRGLGFGDVRLSALLGLVLGQLGWGEWVLGLWSGALLGSVAWLPLRLLRLTRGRSFPFGPFMLLGALAGVLWGDSLWDQLVVDGS